MIPIDVSGSRLPVGSSASRSGGWFTNARATLTRCCSPPESWSGMLWSFSDRPVSRRMSGTFSRISLRWDPVTWSAYATLSWTVRFGRSLKSWKTMPRLRR